MVRRIVGESPETKVVVITAHGTVDVAVEAMKLGAFDFVKKPFELDELLTTAHNALRAGALERRVAYHDGRDRSRFDADMIPGRAPRMVALEREVAMVAPQPVPVVLVVGETGSGKALVARRLHYAHRRARGGPFVELNAAAIPETLVESELFGHERGAFSDARERKLGLVEVADGGTLFLDEIGDLPAPAQAKLLTFLESFSFRRVGATAPRTVDVRLVAATNRDLGAAGQGRALSRRSVLPPERDHAAPAAAARAARGHRARWRRTSSSRYAQRYGKSFRAVSDEAARAARGLVVAGQRARAQGGHPARGADERRRHARGRAPAGRARRRGARSDPGGARRRRRRASRRSTRSSCATCARSSSSPAATRCAPPSTSASRVRPWPSASASGVMSND